MPVLPDVTQAEKFLERIFAFTTSVAFRNRPLTFRRWRRAGVAVVSLVELADADAFQPSLKLARREALGAIKALRDEPLPLFAAASAREHQTVAELKEPTVALRPPTSGGKVLEDYGHIGLTLRSHPLSFLRADLAKRRVVTCREAMQARDGTWLEAAGLVLVRQRPVPPMV